VQTQTIKFICETFRMSLMDDTGLQEFPVIFMNVKNIRLDRRMYEDVDDAAVFILKVGLSLYKLIENGNLEEEERRGGALPEH
jgi:hypothetical protein